MRKLVLIALHVFLVSISVLAQLKTVICESFDNNRRHWLVAENDQETITLKNGQLDWDRKSAEPKFIWQKFDIDYNQDFEIETSVRPIRVGEFGIVWGGQDGNNAHCFTLKNNQFQIAEISNGAWKYIKPFTTFASQNNNQLILKIRKQGSKLLYSINSKQVYETIFLGIKGKKIGFTSFTPNHIAIDYLQILTANNEINTNPKISFSEPPQLIAQVNTPFDELAPIINTSGNKMYFARRNFPENAGVEKKDDIYTSSLDKSGLWSAVTNVGLPFNNANYNYVCSVLPGDSLFLLANAYSTDKSMLSQGVCWGKKDKDTATFAQPILIKDFYSLNSKNDFSLSLNQKAILMAIERRDTYGKNDLYVSLEQDGIWKEPINLGKVINTTQDELCPFLGPDLHTLYFSSRGHAGLGEADIFVATRLDDTWKRWTTPTNLGTPVNSEFFDGYFNFAPLDNKAYFVSETENKHDIFTVPLPKSLQYKPTVTLQGTIVDIESTKLIPAQISWTKLNTNETVTVSSDDGIYTLEIPSDSIGIVSISTLNYYTLEDTIIPIRPFYGKNQLVKRDFKMKKNSLAKKLVMNNILFGRGHTELNTSSFLEIDKLYAMMIADTAMCIEIRGHTDNQGDPQLNIDLSQVRANTIKKYLTEKGISTKKIAARGLGGAYPIANNRNEYTRKLNRRVEIVIISSQTKQ